MRPKNTSQLLPQIDAFLTQLSEEDRRTVVNNIGTLTGLKSLDLATLDEAGLGENVRSCITRNLEHYISFLRKNQGAPHYLKAADNQRLYNQIVSNPKAKAIIDRCRKICDEHRAESHAYREVGDLKFKLDLSTIEGYLGSGREGDAFEIETDDGKVVLKVCSNEPHATYRSITALRAAESISSKTPQIICYSLADNIVVMTRAKGEPLSPELLEKNQSIRDEHVSNLINDIDQLNKAGIQVDISPPDFLYDSEDGFSIIDFTKAEAEGVNSPNLSEMAFVFVNNCLLFHFRRKDRASIDEINVATRLILEPLKKERPDLLGKIAQPKERHKSFIYHLWMATGTQSRDNPAEYKQLFDKLIKDFKFNDPRR